MLVLRTSSIPAYLYCLVFHHCDCLQPEKQGKSASLTAQLLLLYYMLHYEDVRMNNLQVVDRDKVKSYSTEFLSELPIKYLLQQAQRNQQSFAGQCY